MKIVLWLGNEANQKALANKINAVYPVAGIVTESRKQKTKITASKLFEKAIEKLFLRQIGRAWWGMKSYYDAEYHAYPATKLIDVENINSQEAFDFTSKINPDLIIVSGTRLIKKNMFLLTPPIGILNLHTGLSPYIKGGPNCTNWCIATKQYHLIGNTVMWIDAGIDTGNIVTTGLTTFTGHENLSDIHLKVMEHAHSLYVRAIGKVLGGEHPSVKQENVAAGVTYYTKQWTLKEKISLIRNLDDFRKSIQSGETGRLQQSVNTVKL